MMECKICKKRLWKGNKTGLCIHCFNKSKILKPKSYCMDCGIELPHRGSTRCRICYGKYLQKPLYCVDCGKKLNTRTAKRCWSCHKNKVHKNHPIAYCKFCGVQLKTWFSDTCERCHLKKLHKHNTGKKLSKKQILFIKKRMLLSWKDEKFRNKVFKGRTNCFTVRPNKPETVLLNLLPKNFEYVGDWSFVIDRFNPDFIDKKNKLIVELYGDYWHKRPDYIERDKRRLKTYKKLGYRTLIVWESELNDLDKVKEKISNFYNKEK